MIRRFVPSLAKATYNPFFKAVVNAADLPAWLIFKELRQIPPNHLRIRVGMANRLFANQIRYLDERFGLWLSMALDGLWDRDSTIVEIGCGCGRATHILRDFNFQGRGFRGHYYGIDIDDEALDWCRKNHDAERFTFMKSSHGSVTYGGGNGEARYRIDLPDDSVDLVFSTSLFSHLLEPELRNYVEECHRILKPGRAMNMSAFLMDFPPPTLGNRHTFGHRIGNAYVESLKVPEAAVAYQSEFLRSIMMESGFKSFEVFRGPRSWQPYLLCRK